MEDKRKETERQVAKDILTRSRRLAIDRARRDLQILAIDVSKALETLDNGENGRPWLSDQLMIDIRASRAAVSCAIAQIYIQDHATIYGVGGGEE
jgi:hypothetical protein